MDKNQENCMKISDIQLNPRFASNDMFESLVNQGFQVSWMDENELDKDDMVEIEIDDL